MDKQKQQQIEELIGIIQGAVGGCATHWASLIAEEVLKYYQPKIPEGAVVLTEKELFARDENIHKADREYIKALEECINNRNAKTRKETAEKISDKVHRKMEPYIQPHTLYSRKEKELFQVFLDKFDEICKEITEGDYETKKP
jgi:hypothetical protein